MHIVGLERVDPEEARLARKSRAPIGVRFVEPGLRPRPLFDYDNGRMGSQDHLAYLHALVPTWGYDENAVCKQAGLSREVKN